VRAKPPARHPPGRESARPAVVAAVGPAPVDGDPEHNGHFVPLAWVTLALDYVKPDLARLVEAGIGPS
jgi:hypothetical protein